MDSTFNDVTFHLKNSLRVYQGWANTKEHRQEIELSTRNALEDLLKIGKITDYQCWCDHTNNDHLAGCGGQIIYIDFMVRKNSGDVESGLLRIKPSGFSVFCFPPPQLSPSIDPVPAVDPDTPDDAWNRAMGLL